MALIACSSSSLGDEMFELLGCSTDVVLASSAQLEKGRSKERKKKGAVTCDIIITPGLVFHSRHTSESQTQLSADALY